MIASIGGFPTVAAAVGLVGGTGWWLIGSVMVVRFGYQLGWIVVDLQ